MRAIGSVPQNDGQNLTVLAALDCRGVRAAMLVAGATDGDVFLAFVRRVLGPKLRRGDIVVWDRLGAHKVAGVAAVLAAAGVVQHYLPPYSPDYNLIEPAWGKIKTHLRAVGARTRPRLQRALKAALAQVTAHDAAAWFAHCGYPLH